MKKAVAPHHVMVPSEHRSWIPMWTSAEEALERGAWMLKELGIEYVDKSQLSLVRVHFIALGFGHYYLEGTLTANAWWTHWRFASSIPFNHVDVHGDACKVITHLVVVHLTRTAVECLCSMLR